MTPERIDDFNPEMLLLARCARGVTQSHVAEQAGVTQGMISKLENGLLAPRVELVGQLAEVLKVSEGFFRQQGPVPGPSLHMSMRFHRKRKTFNQRALDRIHAVATITGFHVNRLLKSVKLESKRELPFLDIDEFGGDASEVARFLRRFWRLPSGPIRNMVQLVEEAGCIVIPLDFGTHKVDGFSDFAGGSPPLLFVNSRMPVDRLRWTLAHELGHIVMHELPSQTMESEANAFASEFLAPEREVRLSLRRADLPSLARLKPVWKLSMGSLLERARRLGTISESRYRYLRSELSRRGYHRREPRELDLDPEPAHTLNALIEAHFKLGYTRNELAGMLHMLPEEFEEAYLDRRPLRLVG